MLTLGQSLSIALRLRREILRLELLRSVLGGGALRRGLAILPAAFSCILLFSSCARTTVQPLNSAASRMPKPDVVAVHDFSVSPDQVALDHTIGLRLRELMGGDGDANER